MGGVLANARNATSWEAQVMGVKANLHFYNSLIQQAELIKEASARSRSVEDRIAEQKANEMAVGGTPVDRSQLFWGTAWASAYSRVNTIGPLISLILIGIIVAAFATKFTTPIIVAISTFFAVFFLFVAFTQRSALWRQTTYTAKPLIYGLIIGGVIAGIVGYGAYPMV